MDIGSKKGYPSSALSNFAPHPFIFDGIECASMEGLLQAFKFKDANVQVEVCKLVGLKAKYRGKKRNKVWKRSQTLWWMHKETKEEVTNIRSFLTGLIMLWLPIRNSRGLYLLVVTLF